MRNVGREASRAHEFEFHSLALDLSGARILGAFCGNVGAQDAMKGNPQFDPFLRQERRGEMRGQIPNRARARGFLFSARTAEEILQS